jgi:hypothetical protein
VTGGGTIDVAGGDASFGFNVERKRTGGPVTGNLNYVNQATGVHVQMPDLQTLVIAGTAATFTGPCTIDGAPSTCKVVVQDNGEPGKNDSFVITYDGITDGGTLRSGNIQLHK